MPLNKGTYGELGRGYRMKPTIYEKVHTTQSLINRITVLNDIPRERARQEYLHPAELELSDMFLALSEEIGEVSQALQVYYKLPGTKHTDKDDLYEELIQVSALAVRMAEKVLREGEDKKQILSLSE